MISSSTLVIENKYVIRLLNYLQASLTVMYLNSKFKIVDTSPLIFNAYFP